MSSSAARAPRRWTSILLVAVLAAVVNLPLAHGTWTRWRIESAGVERTVEVVATDVRTASSEEDAEYWLTFRYPAEVDPSRREWPARVDEATHREAVRDGEVEVRHLEGDPDDYVVAGEVVAREGLVTTLVADVALLLVALLAWRLGPARRRPALRLAAVEDVKRCPPGSALERILGLEYLVRGEVSRITDDEVVLDLGDREVCVVLGEHTNQVGYQQPAQVRGVMIE